MVERKNTGLTGGKAARRPAGLSQMSLEDRKRVKKVAINLAVETRRLTEHDIASWRRACQMALDHDNPNRCMLYDIYADVELDNHLSGSIDQINGFVKRRSFKLSKSDGETDTDAARYFNQAWFKDMLDYILEANYWGYSLIELGDVIRNDTGIVGYEGARLIPRKHVIPEYHRVTRSQGDDWRKGVDYHEEPYCGWLIEAGKPDDLGKYRKAAMHTIPKKYALSFWDTFAEMFGMPIRIAKTSTRDEGERKKIASMMESMGSDFWGVFTDDTEIEFEESSRGDAFNVYDRRIDRANSELSKLILQQTMTIDDGSSLSQSQTHMKVLENLIETICDNVRDIVNNQLIPRMIRHGFPLQGLSFEWDDPTDYTPEQQVAFETMVLQHYEVPGSYFESKYGIPAGEPKSMLPLAPEPTKGTENNVAPGGFFD